MTLDAWHWMLGAAILLLVVEALVSGFVFAGFALGALSLAVVHFVHPSAPIALDLVLFACASAAGFFLLRRAFRHQGDSRAGSDDVNRY